MKILTASEIQYYHCKEFCVIPCNLQYNTFHIRQPGYLYLTYGYDKVGHLHTQEYFCITHSYYTIAFWSVYQMRKSIPYNSKYLNASFKSSVSLNKILNKFSSLYCKKIHLIEILPNIAIMPTRTEYEIFIFIWCWCLPKNTLKLKFISTS